MTRNERESSTHIDSCTWALGNNQSFKAKKKNFPLQKN